MQLLMVPRLILKEDGKANVGKVNVNVSAEHFHHPTVNVLFTL